MRWPLRTGRRLTRCPSIRGWSRWIPLRTGWWPTGGWMWWRPIALWSTDPSCGVRPPDFALWRHVCCRTHGDWESSGAGCSRTGMRGQPATDAINDKKLKESCGDGYADVWPDLRCIWAKWIWRRGDPHHSGLLRKVRTGKWRDEQPLCKDARGKGGEACPPAGCPYRRVRVHGTDDPW